MPDEPVIRVHDLQTGAVQVLEAEGEAGFGGVNFLPGNRLLSHGKEGLLLWNLGTGEYQILSNKPHFQQCDLDSQRRFFLVATPEGVTLWDLLEKTKRILPISLGGLSSGAISPDGSFVVAGKNGGEVYFLPLDAEEPYLMIGHESRVGAVWISPSCDEIRTASSDGTVCIWKIPNGPRTHNLPHAEFLAMLRAQTNMRVISDVEAQEGFRIEYDPFPGWETAPTW
jgi:WD40 repeat protein